MEKYRVAQAEAALAEAIRLAVPILRRSIVEGQGHQAIKNDGSFGTEVDEEIERSIFSFLEEKLSIPIVGEEGGRAGAYDDSKKVVFVDPQDGTASGRLHSTTATAGACVYNPLTQSFEAATVIDPFGGRLWYTSGEKTYRQSINVYTGQPIGTATPVHTSSKTFADGGEILLDCLHSFTRTDIVTHEHREAMTLHEKMNFAKALHEQCGKVRSASSNLHHQALVADGGAAIGAITSALGGPWDLSGVKLVLDAGGSVAYLRRDMSQLKIIDSPLKADIVICANTKDTLRQLVDVTTVAIKSTLPVRGS